MLRLRRYPTVTARCSASSIVRADAIEAGKEGRIACCCINYDVRMLPDLLATLRVSNLIFHKAVMKEKDMHLFRYLDLWGSFADDLSNVKASAGDVKRGSMQIGNSAQAGYVVVSEDSLTNQLVDSER